jgi:hypothetical protein
MVILIYYFQDMNSMTKISGGAAKIRMRRAVRRWGRADVSAIGGDKNGHIYL